MMIANDPMNISNVEKPEKNEKNENSSATSNLILTELKNARKYNILENSDIFYKGSNFGNLNNNDINKDKENSSDSKISQITTKGKDDHQLALEDNEYKKSNSEEFDLEYRFCTICCIVQVLFISLLEQNIVEFVIIVLIHLTITVIGLEIALV